MFLAKKLEKLKGVIEREVTLEEVANAKEVMMFGTTLDVLPVTYFQNKPVGDGKVGKWAQEFRKLILDDQQQPEFSVKK